MRCDERVFRRAECSDVRRGKAEGSRMRPCDLGYEDVRRYIWEVGTER